MGQGNLYTFLFKWKATCLKEKDATVPIKKFLMLSFVSLVEDL